jgi:HPt (histidine-containing phosphotransfer) domain-containing protein
MEGDSERFITMGFDRYLSKPIQLQQLESVLNEYLSCVVEQPIESKPHPVKAPKARMVDIERMKNELQLPEAILHRLLRTFGDTFEHSFNTLKEAIHSGDPKKIEDAAHYIKGGAANLRIQPIEAFAKELEVLAKLGAVDECKPVFTEIEAAKEGLLHEIKEILGE